jgi:tRNA A-37 threonylcarbamoyl transferase component Bud32/tetratricopeptide (TPR) repeat protein
LAKVTESRNGRGEALPRRDAAETTLASDSPALASTEMGDQGSVAAADFELLARGSTVGRYLVLERLGAGAMGVVYAAYDPELDRKIALKLLRPQESDGDQERRQARMVREAKAIAKVSHPNVVSIFDVGVHHGHVFMAMEHLAGGTLREWTAHQKPAWRDVIKTYVQVGHGLGAAHAERLIHRDFKPDNVLLDKNGVPKVVDFGLVRLAAAASSDSSDSGVTFNQKATATGELAPELRSLAAGPAALTRTGALTGTPAYMAPEQFHSRAVDGRTDQFAFCVSLYESLYGERPFAGSNIIQLVDAVTNGRVREAPKDSQVPGWVRRVLLRGLSTQPERRFQTIEQLIAALESDPARRNKRRVAGGVTLGVALAAVGIAHRLGSGPRTMCTGGPARFAGIWDPGPGGAQRKAAVHRAFAASGKSYAEQAFTGAAKLFDQFAGRWIGMYTEACEATHVRGDQSAEVLDLRMTCLNERLGNARALSDVFAGADGKVVENAVSAAAALPSLDRCADVAGLKAVVKPPEDAATRRRVDELRGELANMVALRDSGQCALAMTKAAPLIDVARKIAYAPLLADTLYESAQIGSSCGDVAETLERFRQAHAAATAGRNDELAAQASSLIPPFAMNRLGQGAVAREWLGVARGDVARLGRETLADAMLAQADGMVALSERAYEHALTAAERSIAITTRLLGADDPLTIQWESNKGDWQESAGRLDAALRTDVEARTHFERVLGKEHPRVALVSSNEGEVLNLLGRYVEAEAACRRAVRLFRQSGASPDTLGWALTGLGRALLGQKRNDDAIAPLEEGLNVRLETHAPSAQLSETRFALARALWARPADRQRAVALAKRAREECGEDRERASEIDEWLRQSRADGR